MHGYMELTVSVVAIKAQLQKPSACCPTDVDAVVLAHHLMSQPKC